MQLKKGASVLSADKHDVGRIDRVVVDPRTNEITHIVVRKGFLLTEDKVIPVHLIERSTEDDVTLSSEAERLEGLPQFEEAYYIPIDGRQTGRSAAQQAADQAAQEVGYATALYPYPPPGMISTGYPSYFGTVNYMTPMVVETRRNIPEGTIAIKEGARVMSADNQHVGDVERVFAEPNRDQVTHFLISRGLLLKESKLVPIAWVKSFGENEIQLVVDAGLLDRVPAYQD
jgi:uncharacterized protein YrrD